jgi:hypothetical protein
LEICCTLEKGTLPTPEILSVNPLVELEPDEALEDVEVDEPVEPELDPPMLTLSTVPVT